MLQEEMQFCAKYCFIYISNTRTYIALSMNCHTPFDAFTSFLGQVKQN